MGKTTMKQGAIDVMLFLEMLHRQFGLFSGTRYPENFDHFTGTRCPRLTTGSSKACPQLPSPSSPGLSPTTSGV